MDNKGNIVLIGFMGAGKTTVGRSILIRMTILKPDRI